MVAFKRNLRRCDRLLGTGKCDIGACDKQGAFVNISRLFL